MGSLAKLGRVPSLFPYIQPGSSWNLDPEIYLRTNGDCVEDPAITENECNEILDVPGVRELLSAKELQSCSTNGAKETSTSARVLDLCCGQGRHSILLAKAYPSVEFHGHDAQVFFLNMAKARAEAAECRNITFTLGDARQVPVPDGWFDLVMVMGNAFAGQDDDEEHVEILQEVTRVLKSGGTFLLDMPSAKYLRSNFNPSGWEWIYGGPIENVDKPSESIPTDRRLLACRERELAPGGKWLASREIVVDLDEGACSDEFYHIRLFDLSEISAMLKHCGMVLLSENGSELKKSIEGHADAGFMAHRDLLVAQKPLAVAKILNGRLDPVANDAPPNGLSPNDQPMNTSRLIDGIGSGVYRHPGLSITINSQKGKCLTATAVLLKDTVIMRDPPYALVPERPLIVRFCSRPTCNKAIRHASVPCSHGCFEDVEWCSANCRFLDATRHNLECVWLSKCRRTILSEHNGYEFTMLWLVVRLLARRYIELHQDKSLRKAGATTLEPGSLFATNNWHSFWASRSNEDTVSPERLHHWHTLAEKYLLDSALTEGLDILYLGSIIGREETNSFGLHVYPTDCSKFEPRVTYGLGQYLAGAMFNHSCAPNVKHEPDNEGRMVFQAARDIEVGEECCIQYFDLKEHVTLNARREMLKDTFQFVCMCERCVKESGADV